MKSKSRIYIIDILILIVLIFLDQLTKYIAVVNLKEKDPKVLLEGILEFNYVENRGAAFGMLQNQKIFFIFIAAVFLIAISYILIKAPNDKKYFKLHILLSAISAGAIGNLIDRIKLDYVVDFIYFKLIDFPVFNFADICVTVSTFFLIILILFVYKDRDFYFLNFKEQKYRELK